MQSDAAVRRFASAVALAAAVALVFIKLWGSMLTGSTAIAADRAHYLMDAVLNGGVLAALVLSRATGWERADAVIALIITGYMLKCAQEIAVAASRHVLDHELPQEQRERIEAAVVLACPGARKIFDLRTRDAGDRAFVEFRLEVDGHLSVCDGHQMVDAAERAIAALFPKETEVIGHLEPCPRLL